MDKAPTFSPMAMSTKDCLQTILNREKGYTLSPKMEVRSVGLGSRGCFKDQVRQ